jgi:hypothetical protein
MSRLERNRSTAKPPESAKATARMASEPRNLPCGASQAGHAAGRD